MPADNRAYPYRVDQPKGDPFTSTQPPAGKAYTYSELEDMNRAFSEVIVSQSEKLERGRLMAEEITNMIDLGMASRLSPGIALFHRIRVRAVDLKTSLTHNSAPVVEK